MLYDLTALQRAANARYAFSAARTLEVAQALYDKKAITYPRTSSRHLSTSVNRELRRHVEATAFGPYLPFVHTILAQGTVTLTARHVDDTKVTDHHAIIPTEQRVDPVALSPDEKRLYDLIVRRFLAALYPDAVIERTTILTAVEGERFTTVAPWCWRPAGARWTRPPGTGRLPTTMPERLRSCRGYGRMRRPRHTGRRPCQAHEGPAALFGRDPARRDGDGRQADGRRRAAARHEGYGPRDPGDARRHH